MDPEQKIVYLRAQILCAACELEAMKAANIERLSRGKALAYPEEAFLDLMGKYGLHHNAVLLLFQS